MYCLLEAISSRHFQYIKAILSFSTPIKLFMDTCYPANLTFPSPQSWHRDIVPTTPTQLCDKAPQPQGLSNELSLKTH